MVQWGNMVAGAGYPCWAQGRECPQGWLQAQGTHPLNPGVQGQASWCQRPTDLRKHHKTTGNITELTPDWHDRVGRTRHVAGPGTVV